MVKRIFVFTLAIFFLSLTIGCLSSVRAAYVLPYPSFMPGNKLYRVSRFIDQVKRYWYWGDLASYRYYLSQSDKSLVEALTLFDYQQYFLALEALERSNTMLQYVPNTLIRAREEGKDIKKYTLEFHDAMVEHGRLIRQVLENTPNEFLWSPERDTPTMLHLRQELNHASDIRESILLAL